MLVPNVLFRSFGPPARLDRLLGCSKPSVYPGLCRYTFFGLANVTCDLSLYFRLQKWQRYCIRVHMLLIAFLGSGDLVLAMHELHHRKASAFWHDISLWPLGFVHLEPYRQFFQTRSGHNLVLRSRQRS